MGARGPLRCDGPRVRLSPLIPVNLFGSEPGGSPARGGRRGALSPSRLKPCGKGEDLRAGSDPPEER